MSIGDKVLIKNNLQIGTMYDDVMFAFHMEKYCGKTATISYVGGDEAYPRYHIQEDSGYYVWSSLMLEKIENVEEI